MKLSDVVNRINGNVDRYTTDLLYYIGGEHFESNELEITNKAIIKDNLGILGFKFHFAFQDRDVIFMARNPHLRKAGMVRFSGLCSDASYILRSKDENILTQEYLAIQLQSDHFWDYCESHKVGSVNFANNWSSIANYEFDLPTIDKQREIADKVWAAYEVKKAYRSMIKATDEMVKSQFIEMFGSIDNNKHRYPVCRISEVCDILNGYAFQSKKYVDTGIRVIRIANVQKGYIEDTDPQFYPSSLFDEYEKYMLFENDLLLSLTGNVGRVGLLPKEMLPAALNQRVACIRPTERINKTFLFKMMNLDSFEKDCIDNSSGSAQKNMSTEWLKRYKFILPPMYEQKKFVRISEQADKSKFELKKAIEAIDKVIKSLINENL